MNEMIKNEWSLKKNWSNKSQNTGTNGGVAGNLDGFNKNKNRFKIPEVRSCSASRAGGSDGGGMWAPPLLHQIHAEQLGGGADGWDVFTYVWRILLYTNTELTQREGGGGGVSCKKEQPQSSRRLPEEKTHVRWNTFTESKEKVLILFVFVDFS